MKTRTALVTQPCHEQEGTIQLFAAAKRPNVFNFVIFGQHNFSSLTAQTLS